MKIIKSSSKDPAVLRSALEKLAAKSSSILILACDANQYQPSDLDPCLFGLSVPVIGGVFPHLIHGTEVKDDGFILIGLDFTLNVEVIKNLSDDGSDLRLALDQVARNSDDVATAIIIVDGLASRVQDLVDEIFSYFGLFINYVGGGAGSLSLKPIPCLFSNQGLLHDAALIALTRKRIGVGVAHGWTKLAGPFRITSSKRNLIKSIDGEPAAKIFDKLFREHLGEALNVDRFFVQAQSMPIGIKKMETEHVVRDPILVRADQSIQCVGEIPEDSLVDILTGNAASLAKAARSARKMALENAPEEIILGLTFDCISRVLYLKDKFVDELQGLQLEAVPLVGVLSLGEIANNGDQYLDFYNKTCVLSLIGS